MGSKESRRSKAPMPVQSTPEGEFIPPQCHDESEIHGTILERGRQLFGAVLPDDEMMNRIRRWFAEKEHGISFDELPPSLGARLLKWEIEGVRPVFDRFIQSDGTESVSFIVPRVFRHGKTEFDGEELEALRAYMRLRIERIGIEPPVRPLTPLTPLRLMIDLIEETQLSRCAIESVDFKASPLFCIPPDVILNLAEQAGFTLLDAKRLSFMELVAIVAKQKFPNATDFTEPIPKAFLWHVFNCSDKTLAKRMAALGVITHPDDILPNSKQKLRLNIESLIETEIYSSIKRRASFAEWDRIKAKK